MQLIIAVVANGNIWGPQHLIKYIAVQLAPNRIFLSYIFVRNFVVMFSCPHVGSQYHLQLHYWTIWEEVHFRGFFFQSWTLFAGRISEAAMEGSGGAQRSVLRGKEPKKTGRACAVKTHYINVTRSRFVVCGREYKEPKHFSSNNEEYWHVPHCSHIQYV